MTDADLEDLFSAIRTGDRPLVESLLRSRPQLARGAAADGASPLHRAAEFDDAHIGVLLLAFGADPKARFGQWNHTPLSWAVTCNAMVFAHTMVRAGVVPDLFCAAGMGLLPQVTAFFDAGGGLIPGSSQTGSSRYAPDGSLLPSPPPGARDQVSDALYIACRNAHVEVARFLLTKGPDLSFRAYMGGTALHWAHFGGSAEIVAALLAAGADPQASDDRLRCTPRAFGICAPASWGFTWLVKQRLGADRTLASFMDGHTSAIHEAARSGSLEVVELLVSAGAPLDLRDGSGRTPLAVAREAGRQPVVDWLATRGAAG